MKQLSWTWFDHRGDLPQWLLAGIGRVAVEWSMLERELEETIRLVAEIDLRPARILTTGMNLRSRCMVAQNFIQSRVYHNKLKASYLSDFIRLKDRITGKIETDRNTLIHGLWGKQGKTWQVLRTSGTRADPELKPDIKRLSRAVLPQSEAITQDRLAQILSDLSILHADVQAYCLRLKDELPTSQYTSPEYTRRRHPSPIQTNQNTRSR